MNKSKIAIATSLLILVMFLEVCSAISVGVKKGDWIEYVVSYTGTPPQGHEVSWARMEVTDIQGTQISLNITTASKGTLSSEIVKLNLETGELGDDFIVPANLNESDVFYDKNFGNITVEALEVRQYAGAERAVVKGLKGQNVDYWDQSTGVLLEGISIFPDYTMNAKVDKTNLWLPNQGSLNQIVMIGIAVIAVIMVLLAIVFLTRRRKNKLY